MPGTRSKDDLVEELKAMLSDSKDKFKMASDGDFVRHLGVAAMDIGRFRVRIIKAELTLVADQNEYAAPTDLLKPTRSLWGTKERKERKPWDSNFPNNLPTLDIVEVSGTKNIWLDPAPTATQIADLGATYQYFYAAGHVIDAAAANTTVATGDRNLLLVRATSQAMQELANWGIAKPVQLGHAQGMSMPKNGTPAALAEQLLRQFERMAA